MPERQTISTSSPGAPTWRPLLRSPAAQLLQGVMTIERAQVDLFFG